MVRRRQLRSLLAIRIEDQLLALTGRQLVALQHAAAALVARRQLRTRLLAMPEDQLRDIIVNAVRNPASIYPGDGDLYADKIRDHWQNDRKRENKMARQRARRQKADAIEQELAAMREAGKSCADAMQALAEKYRTNPEALDKRLRRNRSGKHRKRITANRQE
jgi:hypothetical protein